MAMKKKVLMFVTLLALALFGAILAAAQDQPAAPDQAAPAAAAKPAKMHHMAAAAETLSGTVSSVDADKHVLVVSGSDGVPYNFMFNKGTKIMSGGSKAAVADLQGKQVSVSFVDMKKKGDWAKSVTAQ
jgi:hypothetical protein